MHASCMQGTISHFVRRLQLQWPQKKKHAWQASRALSQRRLLKVELLSYEGGASTGTCCICKRQKTESRCITRWLQIRAEARGDQHPSAASGRRRKQTMRLCLWPHMLEKVEGIVLAFLVFVASHCYGRCGDATSGKRRGAALGRRVQLQAANARRRRSRVTSAAVVRACVDVQ